MTFIKDSLYFISLYFMDTRLPLFYLFSPIMQITHLHPSLWQQQPWHSWQPEAKDFLRLNIRVPVVNPRWMHALCCVRRPQPPLAPAVGAEGAQPWWGCAPCLVGCCVGRAQGSATTLGLLRWDRNEQLDSGHTGPSGRGLGVGIKKIFIFFFSPKLSLGCWAVLM